MTKGKEITIYDLADKLRISSATVSRALKDDPVVSKKTRLKIAELAEEMGYRTNHFARNLRSKKTNTIGVIIPRINSHFMSSVISGIEKVANQSGYNLIISQSGESVEKEIANAKTMFNSRVDGLLVSLAYDTTNINHFDVFFKNNVPIIFYDRIPQQRESTNVIIDNQRRGYEATQHLIEQGCKRIVHVTALLRRNVYLDRFMGYKQALADNDIPFKEEYLIINDLSKQGGAEAAKVIMQMNPLPDAVFVANDDCAVGCMLAMKEAGIRIPEQIAFVGFNNDPVASVVEPHLTTVNYPGYDIGEAAAQNLIDHLKGKTSMTVTDAIVLRSELVIRASSQRKAASGSLLNKSSNKK
ncbi:LacI family transcriptional regulator [Segetibacter sp. 3557_3]|uniref:LacI family DNA-binding transcriptional regulator n=1 Tax=Segetibacter sp. 3557_3 TaxID=2547429 RepID=UPI00105901B0|nr:LacI family DNA-binding transcriptional regulator [Segetibacter sp. 3557_3]TDH27346.1 LacI family transcriptional regulator [Segetibacter sp. 3557_3]